MPDTGLGGKVALVTGAAGGIGSAVVRALLDEGAIVVAADRDIAGLTGLSRERPGDPHLHTSALDVCRPADIALLLDSIEGGLGPVDLAVFVAGILATGRVIETDDESWRRVFAVNVDGVFNMSKALARRMIPRRRGAMVTVSSNASMPRYGMAAYAASKAASTMLTRCLGLELAEHGIRCNIVAPGSLRTPMQEATWAAGSTPDEGLNGALDTHRTRVPLRKTAEPRDVADAVVFLLSEQASHITMAELHVDGGAALRG